MRLPNVLTPRQRALLEAMAEETGFPPGAWTACNSLTLHAEIFAVRNLAAEIQNGRPDWSYSRCLDEAEAHLLPDEVADELQSRPKATRAILARWGKAVKDWPEE